MEGSLEAFLRDKGCTFNETDNAAFKAAIRSSGLYKQWRDHYGPEAWGMLERSTGPLA